MPLFHSYIFSFSITRLSRAHKSTSIKAISTFGSSYSTSHPIRQRPRGKFSCDRKRLLKLENTSIGNQYLPTASFNTLISTRSSINVDLLNDTSLSTLTQRRKMSYQSEQRGSLYNDDFRLYFKNDSGVVISAMHDIPLKNGDNIYNMVVEVPRWSNAKLEISLSEPLNPIKQDVKKGKLRFVANCFPHKGYIWNYGALPQTWEDPTHMDPDTQANGDSDPVDICDIGSKVHEIGSVIQVKILGTLAMIDEGETDWKLLGIDITDPMADKINDIKDVEEHKPGLLAATVEWFKIYKMPDGKPPNTFAFDAEAKDAAFAKDVVEKLHTQWKSLMSGTGHEGIDRSCTQFDCSTKISDSAAQEIVDQGAPKGETKPVDEMTVHKWHHVQL